MKGNLAIEGKISAGMIKIGFGEIGIFDAKKSRTIWDVSGQIVFKGKADFGQGSKISVGKNGTIIVGDNFCITAESSIISHERIEFGNDCLLSWEIVIMDTDFHKIVDSTDTFTNPNEPIVIGNHVWIGSRCTVLKGSLIPNNSIIAANSLVNKAYKNENCVYGGNPLRIITENVRWEK